MPVYQFQHTRVSSCQRVASLSATRIIISADPRFVNRIFYFFRKIFTDAKNAGKGGPSPAFSAVLRTEPHLKPQPIGNHRDKLAVGRFALDARDRVAEVILQGFDVAAVKISVFATKIQQ